MTTAAIPQIKHTPAKERQVKAVQTKPYACSWPGCKNSYARSEHLNRHRLNHEPIKIFTCDQCPKTFVRSDLLYRHKDRHTRKQNKACAAALESSTDASGRRGSAGGVIRTTTFKSIRPARSNSTSSRDEPLSFSSPPRQASLSPAFTSVSAPRSLLQSPFGSYTFSGSQPAAEVTDCSTGRSRTLSLSLPLPSLSLGSIAGLAAQQASEYSQERYQYLPGIGASADRPAAPSSTTSLTSSEGPAGSPRCALVSAPVAINLLNHPFASTSTHYTGERASLPPIRDFAPSLGAYSYPPQQPRTCLSVESMLNSGTSSFLMSDLRRFKQDGMGASVAST